MAEIMIVLKEFEISYHQIISITVDNGANMVSCCKKIDDLSKRTIDFPVHENIEIENEPQLSEFDTDHDSFSSEEFDALDDDTF